MEKNLKKFYQDIEKVLSEITPSEIRTLYKYIVASNRIFFIGNGGSQAICNHMTTDFFKRLNKKAYSLNSDSLITCLANDYGFPALYSTWLERYELLPKDLVIGISSSGTSPDIINGLNHAKVRGANTVLIYGFDERDFLYDLSIYLYSQNYGVIELSTEIIIHHIVERLVAENE